MTTLWDENNQLCFCFEDDKDVRCYDRMSFYREEIEKQISGIKAIDFICVDEQTELTYFIEAKDYSSKQGADSKELKKREKAEEMALEVSRKVLSTISGLWLASNCATSPRDEKDYATKALKHGLKVILHYELPITWSRERQISRLADVKQKLNKKLHFLGNSSLVVDCQLLEDDRNGKKLLNCPMTVQRGTNLNDGEH